MSAKTAASPGRKKVSNMFKEAKTFSSFSVNDLRRAKEFYGETLGLEIKETPEFLGLQKKIWSLLEQEVVKSMKLQDPK